MKKNTSKEAVIIMLINHSRIVMIEIITRCVMLYCLIHMQLNQTCYTFFPELQGHTTHLVVDNHIHI